MNETAGAAGLRVGLGFLTALLLLPFLLRPKSAEVAAGAETLVVLSPHNEAVRHEFQLGFRRAMKARGREVRIDWRTPGGTAEIARYLKSEYRAAFERHWAVTHAEPLTEVAAEGFQSTSKAGQTATAQLAQARQEFSTSNVGIRVDVLFGGGSFDFEQHAKAGRLVDSGFVAAHPELFDGHTIPEIVGGERYYDPEGRWVGAAVSGFGICYGPHTLRRIGVQHAPRRWRDLSDPAYNGYVALADPSKSGSATKAFEMLLQQTMAEAVGAAKASPKSREEALALRDGFDAGLRLIRRIAGNSRYFTDSSNKIPQDIQAGSAAAGMCIDFYGRFQREDSPDRLSFVLPEHGTSLGSDPIGLLRGAPSPGLAKDFISFVLSPAGQSLWALRRGVAGGPVSYALRRLPILPELYEPKYRALRSDPGDNPYLVAEGFSYHAAWTAPLFRAIGFAVRTLCVDAESELHDAWQALIDADFPPVATARFDELHSVDYERVVAEIAPVLEQGDPLAEVDLSNRLLSETVSAYAEVSRLAKEGR